jgi:hypothetical protein
MPIAMARGWTAQKFVRFLIDREARSMRKAGAAL